MKKIIIVTGVICSIIGACKKENALTSTAASLNVINGTLDVPNMAVNFSPGAFAYASNQTFIPGQTGLEFGLTSGSNVLNLVSSNDTTHNLYHGALTMKTGGIYSFYVAGSAGQYSTILMEDELPVLGSDSVAGLRVINLSPDSQPLNISLQGGAGAEFSLLAYKSITVFKKYPATSNVVNNGGYNFNITDASGNVLATFNWVPQVFNKNSTLVITGLTGNSSLSVFSVNNF